MDKNSSMAGCAALLDQQFKGFRKGFNQGDTVSARVVRVGEEFVTLDVNAKTVGLLPVADVTDEEGEVTVKRGDTVEVSFVSMQKDAYLFAKADVAVSAAVVSVDQTIQRAFAASSGRAALAGGSSMFSFFGFIRSIRPCR